MNTGFPGFSINQLSKISGNGVSHNSIYRGANLGTVSNLNEYIAFRAAHGIDDKSYKDLYIGDNFIIQDGTFNARWTIAHFDYYLNKGQSTPGPQGVMLIGWPTNGRMAQSSVTTGAYQASTAHTEILPSVATSLQTVLGTYLHSQELILTNSMNENLPSMAGTGLTGASNAYSWVNTKAVLPTEVQVYGSTVWSSSAYDVGEGSEKLALFNFIGQSVINHRSFWLRAVCSSSHYTLAVESGYPGNGSASSVCAIKPLIYIT